MEAPASEEVDLSRLQPLQGLLFDANHRLPTQTAEQAWLEALEEWVPAGAGDSEERTRQDGSLEQAVRRAMDQAFWSRVEEEVRDGPDHLVDSRLASLVADLRTEILGALAPLRGSGPLLERRARELADAFESAAEQEASRPGPLLELMSFLSQQLTELGSAAREAMGRRSRSLVEAKVASAAGGGDDRAVLLAVVQAARLLLAQSRVLRLDIANAQLDLLSNTVSATEAATSIRDSMYRNLEGPLQLRRTVAWLGQARLAAQVLTVCLADTTPIPEVEVANVVSFAAPSGFCVSCLLGPCEPGSWRGLARCGLVQWIGRSAQEIAAGGAAPEVLALDTARLMAAAESFAGLSILAASATTLGKIRASTSLELRPQWAHLLTDAVDAPTGLSIAQMVGAITACFQG